MADEGGQALLSFPADPVTTPNTSQNYTHTSTSGRESFVREELRFYKDLQEGGEESREAAGVSLQRTVRKMKRDLSDSAN